MLRLLVHFDGGGLSQGGPAGWGVVVAWEDGGIIEQFGGWHPDLTNNEAEYHALIAALRTALKYQPIQRMKVRGDSQLIIRQVLGVNKCKKAHLVPLRDEARRLLAQVPNAVLEWVPREENTIADSWSTAALTAGGPVAP